MGAGIKVKGIALQNSGQTNSTGIRLPISQLCRRYGISARTVDRWLGNQQLGFPRPMVVNRRHYWEEAALPAWDRQQAAGKHEKLSGVTGGTASSPAAQ